MPLTKLLEISSKSSALTLNSHFLLFMISPNCSMQRVWSASIAVLYISNDNFFNLSKKCLICKAQTKFPFRNQQCQPVLSSRSILVRLQLFKLAAPAPALYSSPQFVAILKSIDKFHYLIYLGMFYSQKCTSALLF